MPLCLDIDFQIKIIKADIIIWPISANVLIIKNSCVSGDNEAKSALNTILLNISAEYSDISAGVIVAINTRAFLKRESLKTISKNR